MDFGFHEILKFISCRVLYITSQNALHFHVTVAKKTLSIWNFILELIYALSLIHESFKHESLAFLFPLQSPSLVVPGAFSVTSSTLNNLNQ